MTEQTAEERPRVVVGVDGSPAAQEAIRFAVREAVLRRATLVAVMSVQIPDYTWIDPYAIRTHPEEGYLQQAKEKLHDLLTEVGTGGLQIEMVVSSEPAPAALVAQSTRADLLVVGSRGRGGFRGMVMGSVSLQCVLHAHCPVTVVRPDRPAEEKATAAVRHTLEDARRQTTPTFF